MPLTREIISKYGMIAGDRVLIRLLIDTDNMVVYEVPEDISSYDILIIKLNEKLNTNYSQKDIKDKPQERPLALMDFIDASLIINPKTNEITGEIIGVGGSIFNVLKIKYSKRLVSKTKNLLDNYIDSGKTYIKSKDMELLEAA